MRYLEQYTTPKREDLHIADVVLKQDIGIFCLRQSHKLIFKAIDVHTVEDAVDYMYETVPTAGFPAGIGRKTWLRMLDNFQGFKV